jgi:predicted phage gp36 major capsid-like protein
VPLVPDFSNGERPSGMSGYLCIARYGADVLDVNAFRLLANS